MKDALQLQQKTSAVSPEPARHSPLLQRKCACNGEPGSAGACGGCSSEEPALLRKRQSKLIVGASHDQYEQEADRVADQIATAAVPSIEPSAEGARRELLQRQPDSPEADDEEQDRDYAGGAYAAAADDESSFRSLQGHGQPLAASERAFMEPRFGFSFDQVRVHHDGQANTLARRLGARAFTVGNDVVFGESEFRPGTADGRRLLAHELTHVVQQTSTVQRQALSRTGAPRIQRYLVGPPERIAAPTRTPETYSSCRGYNWIIDWDTDVRDGFIVQEITNAGSITKCDGTAVTPPNTPHFWEAWTVNSSGTVVDGGGGDMWFRAARPATRGNWSLSGDAFATHRLDPAWGFTLGGVADARGLLSTTTGPNKSTDLYMPSLSRTRGGEWDCCEGNNYHRAR